MECLDGTFDPVSWGHPPILLSPSSTPTTTAAGNTVDKTPAKSQYSLKTLKKSHLTRRLCTDLANWVSEDVNRGFTSSVFPTPPTLAYSRRRPGPFHQLGTYALLDQPDIV